MRALPAVLPAADLERLPGRLVATKTLPTMVKSYSKPGQEWICGIIGVLNPISGALGRDVPGLTAEHDKTVWIDRDSGCDQPGLAPPHHGRVFIVAKCRWGRYGTAGAFIAEESDVFNVPTGNFRGFENVGDDYGMIMSILGDNGMLYDSKKGQELLHGVAPAMTGQAGLYRITATDDSAGVTWVG